MRPIIREQGEGNAAQMIRPALQARYRIGADLQDFDIQLLEFFVVRTEPVNLVRSPAGEGKRHECDHDGPAPEAGQRDLLIGIMRGKRKVRRRSAFFDFHSISPC